MSHQTPAQRAANRAFHRKQENKMGKRQPPADPKEDQAEKPKITRKRKSKQDTNINKAVIALMAFLIGGGAILTILDLLFSKRA